MEKIGKKKTWTGFVVVPPLILLIGLGPSVLLVLLVLVATFFGLREFFTLSLPHEKRIERLIGIGAGLFLSLLVTYRDLRFTAPLLVFILLLFTLLFMVTSDDLLPTISNIGVTLFGILYIAFLLSYVSLIRNLPEGRPWVLFLIATVWAGDIAAYLTGSRWGRHKLYPKVSPKKTCEGLLGAIVGSTLVSLVFTSIYFPSFRTSGSLFLGMGIGLLGQMGDLTESMLKRSAQVKDSGTLIPGHGGMLDRLDSFLFSAPFLHYSLLYLFKETP